MGYLKKLAEARRAREVRKSKCGAYATWAAATVINGLGRQ